MKTRDYVLMIMVGMIIFFDGVADGRAAIVILKSGGEVENWIFDIYLPVGLAAGAAVTILVAVWSLLSKKD